MGLWPSLALRASLAFGVIGPAADIGAMRVIGLRRDGADVRPRGWMERENWRFEFAPFIAALGIVRL